MLPGMETTTREAQGPGLTPESEGLVLPPGITLLEKTGSGRSCTVYKVTFQGETLALKSYTKDAINWYRNKKGLNIAVHEMMQNRAFRHVPELLPYTAKPVRVVGQDGSCSLCFLQEFVVGISVADLAARLGKLPGGLYEAGRKIANLCAEKELAGIDQFLHNTLVREHAHTWTPVIHDFKHLAQHSPSKSSEGPSLLARLGLRSKNPDEPAFIRHWRSLEGKVKG